MLTVAEYVLDASYVDDRGKRGVREVHDGVHGTVKAPGECC